MKRKLLFLNTGWMDFYRGLKNDNISGGGKHVQDHGWGGEMFNFKPHNGNCYGYVQPFIDKQYYNPSVIKIEKLGADKSAESITGVTVIWTARDPRTGGTYIVGWYKNARVYRDLQEPPPYSKRNYKKEAFGFYVSTRVNDAVLLPLDKRILKVQRQKKNWMGQSNVWYAEKQPNFLKLVEDYIFMGISPVQLKRPHIGKKSPRQKDILKRIEVEKKAVLFVTNYYKKLGYDIKSVEKDNVGWDLTATNKKMELKLEVKGLSGLDVFTELTPNELKCLKSDKQFYRLCVVSNVLKKPKLNVFTHSVDQDNWCNENGDVLKFEPIIGARISL